MDYKIQFFDRLHDKLFDKEENDRIVRSIISFKNYIDVERVKKAIDLTLISAPYLNSTFYEEHKYDVWRTRQSSDGIISVYNSWATFNNSFVYRIDETNSPQIKVIIYNNILGIMLNNMVCDAFAFKEIIQLFIDNYINVDTPNYISKFAPDIGRDFENFKKKFGFFQRLGIKFSKPWKKLNNDNLYAIPVPFTALDNKTADKFVTSTAIYKPEVDKLIEFAKTNNITVSILYIAAYARAIANTRKAFDTNINIGKYFNAREDFQDYKSFDNLYTILPITIKIKKTDSLLDNAKQIQEIYNYIKTNKLASKKVIGSYKENFSNAPYFQYIDLGLIDDPLKNVTDNPIIETYISSEGRNIPYIAISTVTYNGNTHFSSINYCNNFDANQIKHIMDWIKYEIRMLVYTLDNNFYKTFNDEEYSYYLYNERPAVPIEDTTTKSTHKTKTHSKTKKTITKKSHNSKKISKQHEKFDKKKLIKEYKKLTNVDLIPVDENHVKYRIKGKKTFQKRSYEQINKFIEYKISKKK